MCVCRVCASSHSRRYAWLRGEIIRRGGRVDNPQGLSDAQRVDYALRLLGDCLDMRRTLIEPNLTRARGAHLCETQRILTL